jgi:agmatinase
MDNVLTRFPEVERVVQVGVRDLCDEEFERIETSNGRVVWFPDSKLKERQFGGEPWNRQVDGILEGLGNQVYLSFDIDGLDPSLCPNTGTPVPGGLSFAEVSYLLVRLVRSGRKIVGFDLVEVAPAPDGNEWDASVGARLLYKMCLATLESGGERTR